MVRPDPVTDRPVGPPVAFTGAPRPEPVALNGRHVDLVALDPEVDAEALFGLSHAPTGDPSIWTYLFEAPFPDTGAYRHHLEQLLAADDVFWTVLLDGRPAGQIAALAVTPEHGTLELGNIWFGRPLQRTRAATEAIFLLLAYAFDELGYRRVEWKCNTLNAPSRAAALRFGFTYEGTFRRHRVVKGHSRDTAWFAIIDADWPAIRTAFERWLDPANFDPAGHQRTSLRSLQPPAERQP